MKTIRQIIKDIQNELSQGNLQPDRSADLLVQLAALLGNINDEILKRDVEYNKVLLSYLENEGKVNRAKIKAEVSQEYILKKEAYNTRGLAQEMIRSLKYLLRAKLEEYQISNH